MIFLYPYVSRLNLERMSINKDVQQIYNISPPLASDYDWDLTGSPIVIDDTNPSKDWAFMASTYGWCSGSGTWNDPYLISSVKIDGQGTGGCITIENSDVYFQIKNCYLYNSSYAGISLVNVNNSMLIQNLLDNNDDYGIAVEEGQNNTISANTANNSYWAGIWLGWFSSYNTVVGNLVSDNRVTGILIEVSDNNEISDNSVLDNIGHGIHLSSSDNNIVSGNDVRLNHDGIRVYNGNYNRIFENTVSSNSWGIRIYLRYSSYESCERNTIWGNSLKSSYYCDAYEVLEGKDNHWYYKGVGNYYSQYSGKDTDDDGIGDTPYLIPGSGNVLDYFPFWWDAPEFTVNTPSSNQEYGMSPPEYSITIDGGIPVRMWYTIGSEYFNFTNLQGTINAAAWDELPDGNVTINFSIEDSEGLVSTVSSIIIKNELIVYVSIFTIVGISSAGVLGIVFIIRRGLKKRD